MNDRMRIYKPAKTATQSGKAKTGLWVAEFETADALSNDPLMGWVSLSDTRRQLRLTFETLDQAIAFAKEKGAAYTISTPTLPKRTPKSYGENFTNPRIRGSA